MSTRARSGFRSLADQLRSWPEDRLRRLLTARVDLATPPPHDVGQLASRATVRASISRALDILSRPDLCVLDALVVAGQTRPADLRDLVHAERATVDAALERLVDLALVWEAAGGLRPLSGVADALVGGPEAGVSGLWPRDPDPISAERVAAALGELSPEARELLDRFERTPHLRGSLGRDRPAPGVEDAASPGEELLARRLLVTRDERTSVVLPGEVAVALRGGTTTREPVDLPPPVATGERGPVAVGAAAAGAATEAVRRVAALLDHWGTRPAAALRDGGLGVRELRATAAHLQVGEPEAALWVETAAAAALVATRADGTGRTVWVPTDAYDDWLEQDLPARWSALARAWLGSDRVVGLVGSRDQSGATRSALSEAVRRPGGAEARRMALEVLADLVDGQVLAAGTGVPSVVARVAFERPRRPRARADLVAWALDEAALLGLTGLGGAAPPTRPLLAGDAVGAARAMRDLLPDPIDHVLVQADLTAVAPGPLETDLARRMAMVADVESHGAATTYRFSASSVRRALDLGWTPAEVHAFLGSVSRTPLPQPLTYLVDDTARTFGALRVGPAEAFVRSDDEAALAALVGHPRAGRLGLRLLAPTVAVAGVPVDVLLPRLRDLGLAPVVEGPDGVVAVARPEPWRARTPRPETGPQSAARAAAQVAAAVRAVRAGETARPRAAVARPGTDPEPLPPSGSLSALREAVEAGLTVAIGYADDQGGVSERVVAPVAVEGGHLTARDAETGTTRTIAVHRVTTVRVVGGGERRAP